MKTLIVTLLAMCLTNAMATEQPSAAEQDVGGLLKGESFVCQPLPSTDDLIKSIQLGLNTVARCTVLSDIRGFGNKEVVIPRGSTFVGEVSNQKIEWRNLILPDGLMFTGMEAKPAIFVSVLQPGAVNLNVTVLEDFKLQVK